MGSSSGRRNTRLSPKTGARHTFVLSRHPLRMRLLPWRRLGFALRSALGREARQPGKDGVSPFSALKNSSNRQKLQSYTDLSPGDLVVHVHHGVGRFVGIQKMPVDGVEKDYIKIDYAGGDCLYVPVTQLDQVSKYIGGGEDQERTKLNKLGGTECGRMAN